MYPKAYRILFADSVAALENKVTAALAMIGISLEESGFQLQCLTPPRATQCSICKLSQNRARDLGRA
jgi:hypothetical protein